MGSSTSDLWQASGQVLIRSGLITSPAPGARDVPLDHVQSDSSDLAAASPILKVLRGRGCARRTLETLLDELPLEPADPLYGRVRVLVMNAAPPDGPRHAAFEELRKRFEAQALGDHHAKKVRGGRGADENPVRNIGSDRHASFLKNIAVRVSTQQ